MTKDKKVLYCISFIIFAVLLFSLFINVGSSKIVTALLLIPMTVATCLLIKRRRTLSINKKEVLLLACILSVLYVVLYQMSGLNFSFYGNPYFVDTESLLWNILPTALIIVLTEIIRYVLLAQDNKLVSFITYLTCVIIEALTYSNIAGIVTFNSFMNMIGLTLLPAITANLYYHHVSKRYGMVPNIVFRLVTTLYIYFIPMITGMSDSLSSCIRIIFPIGMLILTSALFENKKQYAVKKGKKFGVFSTVITVLVVVSVAMLISCQFRFGALVIATESMTGEINKGDVILYERYDDQNIKEGQVVVFSQNESRIVHRVVQIQNIGGEIRYYTKGDANEDWDDGYRLKGDIVGLTDVKLPFIGYPTLWLREIISN